MIMIEFSFMATNRRGAVTCRNICSPLSAFLNSDSECDSEPVSMDLTMEEMRGNEYVFTENSHAAQILDGLNDLRKRGELCDVTIAVEGHKFPAHKNVLCSFSPYFKGMFLNALAESRQNTVTLRGVDPDMVGLLLDYAYTSSVNITKNNVLALLSAANLLQVLPVKDAACRFLRVHMDATNCLGIHCFAEVHACTELQNLSLEYALENFWEVYHGEEFLTLTVDKLIELTKSDALQVEREEIVFKAVSRWYLHLPDQRKPIFPKVLETVRLGLISPYFLVDRVESLPVVKDSPSCMQLIEEAKLYHLLPDRRAELPLSRSKPRSSSHYTQVIIAVGGEDDKVVLRGVECFSPSNKSWKSLACLPFAISKHGIVASGKNNIYLAGGEFPDGGPSRNVLRYEAVLDTWQEVEPMLVPRSELGLGVVDGEIYAIGGWDGSGRLDSCERYDPTTNTWTMVSPMKTALTSPAVATQGCNLFVTGGAVLEDGDGIHLVQKYSPLTDSWTEMPPMRIPRSGAAACSLGDYIYVVGGWHASTENTNRCERFNTQTNTWELRASMLEKRYRPGIAVIGGMIYVLGGEEGWDKYHQSIEAYDPVEDKWVFAGELPTPRSSLSCLALQIIKSVCRDKS
nr:kelch-like protein diablo isoform X2 [Halyomorpha halys]